MAKTRPARPTTAKPKKKTKKLVNYVEREPLMPSKPKKTKTFKPKKRPLSSKPKKERVSSPYRKTAKTGKAGSKRLSGMINQLQDIVQEAK